MRGVSTLRGALAAVASGSRDGAQAVLAPLMVKGVSCTRLYSDAAEAVARTSDVPSTAGPDTKRTGVVAVKMGMTQEWDNWGRRLPLTVLWLDGCKVVQVKTEEKEGYTALQVGIGAKRPKQVPPTLRGHFQAAGVPILRKLAEFRVTPDAVLPVGTELPASLFVPGQYVDVVGTSMGKGFQGTMKKWNFAGGPASHGNSLTHRAPGSIGQAQDPGRVWKGKKMAGRMGGERTTVQNCLVYKVDPVRDLVYVVGQVPGHKGNFVLVSDSIKKAFEEQPERPVAPVPSSQVAVLKEVGRNPYEFRE